MKKFQWLLVLLAALMFSSPAATAERSDATTEQEAGTDPGPGYGDAPQKKADIYWGGAFYGLWLPWRWQ